MIILAATIVISLTNSGIITKANEAVDKTNESEIQELASLAWADAYAENVGKSETELQAKLQEAVEKVLSDNNLDKEDYYINVTTSGVTIKNIDNVWIQKSDYTVVKGDKVLNIGDTIEYDATCGGTITGLTDTTWKVLGAENGELLILSDEIIESNVTTGVTKLNELCEPYGTGENATGARCITADDIYRISGYDKTEYVYSCGIKYGDELTVYLDKELPSNPFYAINSNGDKFIFNASYGYFDWKDQDGYHKYDVPSEPIEENIVITTFTNTYCGEYESYSKLPEKIQTMFFGTEENDKFYILDTIYYGIMPSFGTLDWGWYCVMCSAKTIISVSGNVREKVRCVVRISSDYTPN